MTEKEHPGMRFRQLMNAAMEIAVETGFASVTRDGIARRAGVSSGLVSLHLGTMKNLRRTLMRAAVREEVLSVVAEGVATRDPTALKATAELRERALRAAMQAAE